MSHTDIVDLDAIAWGPSPAPSVVLEGEPSCREAVLLERDGLELGLWEVTPARFASRKPTVGESMTFLAGAGRIEHADGSVTEIRPGVVLHIEPGWEGVWDVTETVVKSYAIYAA